MRRRVEAVSLVGLVAFGGSLGACAAVSGLDNIVENDCFPHLCDDASTGPASGDVFVGERLIPFDARQPPPGEDAAKDAHPWGSDDAGHEPADARADAPSEIIDAANTDAENTDAPGADAPVVDAMPEAADSAADTGPTCTVYFSEPFDDNGRGWKLDPTWSIGPECATPPSPPKGNPDPTVDHTSGSRTSGVAGAYVCGNTPAQIAAPSYATSPAIDISAATTAKLTFYRWLNSDESKYMTSTVEVFDGSSWVSLYTNPSSALVTDAAWTKQEYDVTAYKGSTFRVRFGYSLVSTSVWSMSSWNVDDVTVSTTSCP